LLNRRVSRRKEEQAGVKAERDGTNEIVQRVVELDRFVVVTKPGSCEQIIKSETERKIERSDDW